MIFQPLCSQTPVWQRLLRGVGTAWPGLILALSLVSLQAAGPSLTITTNYYAVLGTNHTQIRQSMIASRPWSTSLPYDAFTKWDVTISFTMRRYGTNWGLNTFEVKGKASVTLPRWIPGQPVSPELANDWKNFYQALARHEGGHLKLAREAAAEVHQRLLNLPPTFSVDVLRASANRAVAEVVEDFRSRERDYDRQTRNGAAEGARFPPRPSVGPGKKEGGLQAP